MLLRINETKHYKLNFCFRTKDSSLRFPLLIFLSVNLLLVLVAAIVLLGAPMLSKNRNLCLTEQCVNAGTLHNVVFNFKLHHYCISWASGTTLLAVITNGLCLRIQFATKWSTRRQGRWQQSWINRGSSLNELNFYSATNITSLKQVRIRQLELC